MPWEFSNVCGVWGNIEKPAKETESKFPEELKETRLVCVRNQEKKFPEIRV